MSAEQAGFDGGDAAEAPAGGCEDFDEFGFEGGGGLELGEECGPEGGEFFGGFGGEEDSFGVEAVLEGILGGAGFAGGGGGAAGFGSVQAGGCGFEGRRHDQGIARVGAMGG